MREIQATEISDAVRDLFMRANYEIGADVQNAVRAAREDEPSPVGREVLGQLCENYDIARCERVALCQDTGMAVLFIECGQDAHVVGGAFEDAVNEGVRRAYRDGYLRKSVVRDPLFDRANTLDNTPAVLHTRIVPGDAIRLLAVPKGFGSENMSAIAMLSPSKGAAGALDFVVETVKKAGPNPCPPVIVGVGIGGTFDSAARLAKRMTARPLDEWNADPRYRRIEEELLERINKLGIGPAGLGGGTTCLKVNVDWEPTHIAGLPVAVNICCHAARHAETVL